MWGRRNSGHISYVLSGIMFGSKLWDLHYLKHMNINPQHNSIHTDGEQEDEYLLKLWPDRGEEESHVSHSVIDLYYFQCKSF